MMTGWTTIVVVAFGTIVLLAKALVFPPPNGYRRWWKNRTRFDAEMHEAFATMYLIGAAVFSVFWLIDPSDWQTGLVALATIALTMYHFWRGRVQFGLRTILVFMTYAAVVIGLSSAAIHILRK